MIIVIMLLLLLLLLLLLPIPIIMIMLLLLTIIMILMNLIMTASPRGHQTCHFRKRATSVPAEGPAYGLDFARH